MHWTFLTGLAVVTGACIIQTLTASSISNCPALRPRVAPPKNALDLRIDDIKVIAALGDSIMAGFALEGMGDTGSLLLNLSSMQEWRGRSWAIGGDEGAVTLGNFVKRYSPRLLGQSKGSHVIVLCTGALCLNFPRFPKKDVLNAAMSAAIAQNLDGELDYLIRHMKELPGIDFQNDWKMITIQIGSYDQCVSCMAPWINEVQPDKFGAYIEAAMERIRAEIPKSFVNLAGSFKVSPVYTLTKGHNYCNPIFDQPDWIINRLQCPCFLENEDKIARMDAFADAYNVKIKAIYKKYKALNDPNFAIAYQPADLIDVSKFPIDDCFHPSGMIHEWVAKVIWNGLFTPIEQKRTDALIYDADLQVYCPTEEDRLRL